MQKQLIRWIGLLTILLLAASVGPAASADQTAHRNGIQQRIKFMQSYLESKRANSIAASHNDEARQLLEQARDLLVRGQQEFTGGRFEDALKASRSHCRNSPPWPARLRLAPVRRKNLSGEIESIRAEVDAYLNSFNTTRAVSGER